MMVVNGKVRRTRPVHGWVSLLKGNTCQETAKLCIPAPTYLHMRGGRQVVNEKAYPDVEEFWSDITLAYREEIAELADAGLEYLQIDDVSFACLCDEGIRAQVRRDGEDPARLPPSTFQWSMILSKNRPKTMAVTMHTCRGNHASMWMAEGGYDAVAEAVFQTEVDGFFLEYDTARAGGFEPLRFVPKGKKVVLGLISTKTPVLKRKELEKARVEEAAKIRPARKPVPVAAMRLRIKRGRQQAHRGRPEAKARARGRNRARNLGLESATLRRREMKKLLIAAALAAGFGAAHAQQTVKIGLVLSPSGQFADAGAAARQRHQDLHEDARRHRRRQEDRAHPPGHRRPGARRGEAPVAGAGGARQGRHARRLRAHAQRHGRRPTSRPRRRSSWW